jgi:hypothetical protein
MLTLVNLKAKKFTNNELFTQSTIAYAPFTIGPIDSKTLYSQSSSKALEVGASGNKETLSFKTFDNTFVSVETLVYTATGNIESPGYGTFDAVMRTIPALVYTAGGPDSELDYETFSSDGKTFNYSLSANGSNQ